jgi:hypothetical protein
MWIDDIEYPFDVEFDRHFHLFKDLDRKYYLREYLNWKDAEIARLESQVEGLHDKIHCLVGEDSEQIKTCCCNWDAQEVCKHHSPMLMKAEAEIARLREAFCITRTKLRELAHDLQLNEEYTGENGNFIDDLHADLISIINGTNESLAQGEQNE